MYLSARDSCRRFSWSLTRCWWWKNWAVPGRGPEGDRPGPRAHGGDPGKRHGPSFPPLPVPPGLVREVVARSFGCPGKPRNPWTLRKFWGNLCQTGPPTSAPAVPWVMDHAVKIALKETPGGGDASLMIGRDTLAIAAKMSMVEGLDPDGVFRSASAAGIPGHGPEGGAQIGDSTHFDPRVASPGWTPCTRTRPSAASLGNATKSHDRTPAPSGGSLMPRVIPGTRTHPAVVKALGVEKLWVVNPFK